MKRALRLLRAQIMNFFPVNEILEPGNKKKNTAVIAGFGIITVILFLCVYNILTAAALAEAGQGELIPVYMVSVSSFAILFLTMFRSNGILFGCRDRDMLASLPVTNSEIIGSKFLFLYLMNLVIGSVFMIPGGIIWAVYVKTDLLRFALFLLAAFFVPLIPMCLAAVLGVLIVFFSSRFKNTNLFSLLFSFAALGIIGALAVLAGTHKEGEAGNIGAMLAGQVTGLYPLSGFFLESGNGAAGIGLFLILSAAVFLLFIKMTAAKYTYLNTLAASGSKYSRRRIPIRRHSPFAALCRKEYGRFFSSYTAVLNTGFGVLLLCIFSIFLLVMPPEQLGQYAGIEDLNGFLSDYAPVVVAAMLSLSCPAASSVSLEGKNVWILQSAPVAMRTIINSKIALNMGLHFFGYLPAVSAVLARVDMTALQAAGLLCIPACYSVFIAVLGVFLNKRYPNYDWDSEVTAVKQSIPAIAAGTAGMALVAVPVLLCRLLSVPILPALWVTAGILLAAALMMYRKSYDSNYL